MRIGIDGSVFIYKQYTGVAKSVYEIIKIWIKKYPKHEYFLFSRSPMEINLHFPKNWHQIIILDKEQSIFDTKKFGKVWSMIKFPWILKKYNLDVFWGPNYVLPLLMEKKTKYYVTIHDLAIFLFNEIGEKNNYLKLKLFSKIACRKSEKVIVDSESTAKDVEYIFGIAKNKIRISYCGSPERSMCFDVRKVKKNLLFEEGFYLFIGTFEPRKNIVTIIKGFEEYLKVTGNNKKMVLAGKNGWNSSEIFKTIENSVFSDRFILPGYVSDDDKDYLYNNAEAFLFPSIYEGFGLPVLEAFRYHLPVIITNVSSLPEVGGEAAFYIESPYDYKCLASKMIEIDKLNNKERTILKEKMDAQLDKFSWEKNADEVMQIISGKI